MRSHLPDYFKCPISLEIMSDPVILVSGHTFDRDSIQRWLDTGNRTCPITKLPLPHHPTLIPNHALRSLISSFTLASPNQSHSPFSLQSLLNDLASPASPMAVKLHAICVLHRLSRSNPAFRRRISDSGAGSVILRVVSSGEPQLQESALSLLLDLSLDDDNKVGLVAEGAIPPVLTALREGTPSCRALAATTLTSLCIVEVNKGTIGGHPSVIPALVDLLQNGDCRGRREAATAIYTLCSFSENQMKAVRHGAVPVLIELAGSGVERAVELLALLSKSAEGREVISNSDGSLPTLLAVLKRGTPRSISQSLLALSLICPHSPKISAAAVKGGVLEICSALVTDENEKVRRNATCLLQALGNAACPMSSLRR